MTEFGVNRTFAAGAAHWTRLPIEHGRHLFPDAVVEDGGNIGYGGYPGALFPSYYVGVPPPAPYQYGLPKWLWWLTKRGSGKWHSRETMAQMAQTYGDPPYLPASPTWHSSDQIATASDGSGGQKLICRTHDAPDGGHSGEVAYPAAWPNFGCTFTGANGNGFTTRLGGTYRLQMDVEHLPTVEARSGSLDPTHFRFVLFGTTFVRMVYDLVQPLLINGVYYDIYTYGGGGNYLNYGLNGGELGSFVSDPIAVGETWHIDESFRLPEFIFNDAPGEISRLDTFHNCYLGITAAKPNYFVDPTNRYGASFAIHPGWSFAETSYTTPSAAPVFGPDPGPTYTGISATPGAVYDVPAEPVPTFSGCPVVTFPQGCVDPGRIHVAFTTPTFDRAPSTIPYEIGDIGGVGGTCGLGGGPGSPVSGILPTGLTGNRFDGYGAIRFDLYIDGVLYGRNIAGTVAAGDAFSVDVLTTDFGLPTVDWTVAHDYTIKVEYEDVPSWQRWVPTVGYSVVCPPVIPGGTGYIWPWNSYRAYNWPTGFDPSDGLAWGPFGADPSLQHTIEIGDTIVFGGSSGSIATPAVSYAFDSPACSYACSSSGFFDPASATVAANSSPGFGGNPVGYGGVAVSTEWGCQDGRSFKITPTTPGSSPYAPGDQPAYVELSPSPGGSYDVDYYQSMVLYLPPGFTALSGDDEWLIMGIRSDPTSGPSAWSDPTTGLALRQYAGAFTIRSFVGSPDSLAVTLYGPQIPVQVGEPICLRLRVRRNSDTAGTAPYHFWQYQVNDTVSAEQSARSLYNRPAHPVWGLLDNINHQGFGGGNPTIYYVDDLRYDTSPVGCNCPTPEIKAPVFRHRHRAEPPATGGESPP